MTGAERRRECDSRSRCVSSGWTSSTSRTRSTRRARCCASDFRSTAGSERVRSRRQVSTGADLYSFDTLVAQDARPLALVVGVFLNFDDSAAPQVDAMKPAKGASLYSRLINRPMGRVLAKLARRAGLSANALTVVSALLSAGGIA